jgi:hypothetical protein
MVSENLLKASSLREPCKATDPSKTVFCMLKPNLGLRAVFKKPSELQL